MRHTSKLNINAKKFKSFAMLAKNAIKRFLYVCCTPISCCASSRACLAGAKRYFSSRRGCVAGHKGHVTSQTQ